MTRTPLSRSKGQTSWSPGRFALLARQAAAAVGVRKCWPWETAATLTLPSARRPMALWRPRGRRGAGIPWRPPAYSLLPLFRCYKVMTYSFFRDESTLGSPWYIQSLVIIDLSYGQEVIATVNRHRSRVSIYANFLPDTPPLGPGPGRPCKNSTFT